MLRYGSDKPDLRFGLEIVRPRRRRWRAREFKVFAGALAAGGVVRGLNAGAREVPRTDLDALTEVARRFGAGGLAWAFVQEDGALALADRQVPLRGRAGRGRRRRCRGKPGDLLLIVADKPRVAATALGELRLELARRFGLVPEGRHDVALGRRLPDVRVERDGRPLDRAAPPVHGAARAPSSDPGAMSSRGYDLVLDGVEIGGGSIRINTPEVQQQVFKVLGIGEEEAQRRFGFLLDALQVRRPAARRDRVRDRPDRGDPRRAATRSAT